LFNDDFNAVLEQNKVKMQINKDGFSSKCCIYNKKMFQNVVLFLEVIDFVSMAVAKENYRQESNSRS
jgi:hypothetical protein